jgi:hypothetical protein
MQLFTFDKNFMQEEIKSRLNSGNACYHSVQSLLSSRLLPVVLYGCETWSLIWGRTLLHAAFYIFLLLLLSLLVRTKRLTL